MLLFTAFNQINAIDNLQHVGLTKPHAHSALSSTTMLDDHDHHHEAGETGNDSEPSAPSDHPEHAHPNTLGNIAPTIVVSFEATQLRTVDVEPIVAREGLVTGHLQQTPDRPPKT